MFFRKNHKVAKNIFHSFPLKWNKKRGATIINDVKEVAKEEGTILSEGQITDIIEQIETHFEEQKPYLKKGYTLGDLSNEMNINRGYLSKAMNAYGIKFTKLLNYLRIKEAQQMLQIPNYQSFTIEAIAEAVGYKSKSTFNHHFKQNVGCTPKEFRRKVTNALKI